MVQMQPHVEIRLDEVQRQEDGFWLAMTVSKGTVSESLILPVAAEVARSLEAILNEKPFNPLKLGDYCHVVEEITEGHGIHKTLVVQISKERSRTKRSVIVDQALFLVLWNVLHFNVIPSELPLQRRQN